MSMRPSRFRQLMIFLPFAIRIVDDTDRAAISYSRVRIRARD
jgi:hypothetical protein